ncbi:hypothetical protein IQ07DRAFT_258255 [Pyrenochaeta sp. DS3sAY3a]|nr:hypothetical protein IQ07DRAFT_258255 [Pyrenochaeta sp. DS3sAY3a]
MIQRSHVQPSVEAMKAEANTTVPKRAMVERCKSCFMNSVSWYGSRDVPLNHRQFFLLALVCRLWLLSLVWWLKSSEEGAASKWCG